MDSWTQLVLAALAAVGAGAVNALAGGGTLITFPTLVALGVPAVAANVTNTVALCPGYFGATLAQRNDLRGQERRLAFLLPVGVLGGILGGLLLLHTGERLFQSLVPVLILLASALLAVQGLMRAWVAGRVAQGTNTDGSELTLGSLLPAGLAAVYGGYFGAGMSVVVLAVLGLVLDDSLTRLNALKQAFALSVNLAAAVYFLFSGQVGWHFALVMAVGALAGGALGGRLAGRINPGHLRWLVVSIGVLVAVVYWVR